MLVPPRARTTHLHDLLGGARSGDRRAAAPATSRPPTRSSASPSSTRRRRALVVLASDLFDPDDATLTRAVPAARAAPRRLGAARARSARAHVPVRRPHRVRGARVDGEAARQPVRDPREYLERMDAFLTQRARHARRRPASTTTCARPIAPLEDTLLELLVARARLAARYADGAIADGLPRAAHARRRASRSRVPIAIHLIGRRRARVVKFAALDFLLATKRRTARRLRLRERTAARVVRALACLARRDRAREAVHVVRAQGPAGHARPAGRGARDRRLVRGRLPRSTASRGCERADRRGAPHPRRSSGPEAEVAIVRASEGAEHPTELTRDHLRLRDQLLALEPSARPADTTRALARAAQLLAASSHARKTVFLLSLAREDRASRRRAAVGRGRPGARHARSAARAAAEPRGDARCASIPIRAPASRGVAFDAEVGNFSDAPAKVELSLSIARSRRRARPARRSPRDEQKTKRFLAALPPGARATDASVSLDAGDALAIDDRRWVRATLRDEVRVLLVDGDPRTVRHDDELFYLEAALRPGDRDDSGTSVRSITAEELAGIDPHARPHRPPTARPRRLRRRRARERRRAAARARRDRSPTGCAPAAASSSRRAIASIRPRTTARCCRCCRRACAIRSTPPGARRPRSATAARCTS